MRILPISDPLFQNYGQILEGFDLEELGRVLKNETPLPDAGTIYVASDPKLEDLPVFQEIADRAFGGMPTQLGYCNGRNTKMNCLEYHRDSELNFANEDFILLLAKREELVGGRLDSSNVVGFKVPKGVLVEVYATSLHYAPCSAKKGAGFQVLVGLPKGTNTDKPEFEPKSEEDKLLRARNKWLLAHADSKEAKEGAPVMIDGENIDIENLI
jgi:hypothetical protein